MSIGEQHHGLILQLDLQTSRLPKEQNQGDLAETYFRSFCRRLCRSSPCTSSPRRYRPRCTMIQPSHSIHTPIPSSPRPQPPGPLPTRHLLFSKTQTSFNCYSRPTRLCSQMTTVPLPTRPIPRPITPRRLPPPSRLPLPRPTLTPRHGPCSRLRRPLQPLPWPPETQKKKMNIAMFWRRTPPETVLQSVDLGRTAPPEPSPSRETVSPHRPAPARNVTAPETIQTATRPILPPRPVTTAADSKPPPAASRRIIGGRVLRAHELDRIDELDESNPLGLPLHHRGPYEAVQESNEEDVTHNIGSQYQITSSPPIPKSKQDRNKPHARNLPQMTSVPIIPAGVSLNLSPGQILPRNFYHQLNQNHVSPGLFDAPGWPPRPRPQPDIQQSTYPARWRLSTADGKPKSSFRF
ncbi:hypothetical protein FPV67DRAFT_80179 [Lyophyllum atratum]|nr:hypothetical protein FPV67DRAFT_80179 [Lyophyllum atratum]